MTEKYCYSIGEQGQESLEILEKSFMVQSCRSTDTEGVHSKKKGEQATGRGRKGLGTTIHMAISSSAFVACQLFPAPRQDCKSFEELAQALPWESTHYIVADKGYNSSTVRNIIRSHEATPVIPFKRVCWPKDASLTPEDGYDVKLYKKRHLIERFFGRLKENKRMAMRFDKMDFTFPGFIALAIAKLYKLFC